MERKGKWEYWDINEMWKEREKEGRGQGKEWIMGIWEYMGRKDKWEYGDKGKMDRKGKCGKERECGGGEREVERKGMWVYGRKGM